MRSYEQYYIGNIYIHSLANDNLCSQYRRRRQTQMGSCHIFCRPPCWYMFVRCGTRRCFPGTRSHLSNIYISFSCRTQLKNNTSHTQSPTKNDLCSQHRRRLYTQMGSCRIFYRPQCWCMFFCRGIRRCCSGTRSHLNNTCVFVICRTQPKNNASHTPHIQLLLH